MREASTEITQLMDALSKKYDHQKFDTLRTKDGAYYISASKGQVNHVSVFKIGAFYTLVSRVNNMMILGDDKIRYSICKDDISDDIVEETLIQIMLILK